MGPVFKILNRCVVVEFYKQNAAFFGLLFLVLFGFIKSSEHIAIGSFLVANPSALFFLYLIWIGYAIKVILFALPTLNKAENGFFESFFLLPVKTKLVVSATTSSALLGPLIAYTLFLVILAIANSFYISLVSVTFFLIALIIAITRILYKKLIALPHEKTFIQLRFLNKAAKPFFLFFIEHLFRNELVLLLLSKAYTCLLIIGASALYNTGEFDLRLITTGILLSLIGNVAILHRYLWFYFLKLRFAMNLPHSFLKTIGLQFLTFLIIIIPEMVIIIRYYPIDPIFVDVIGILGFGFSLTTLSYSLLVLKQVELSDFVIKIFWLVVLTTFLILFSVHPLLLTILYILISTIILYFRHYKFEFVEKTH